MIDRLTANVKKPESNEYGEKVLERMNESHNQLALWALSHTDISSAGAILDIGCGGGRNIGNMLAMSKAKLYGIDYSEMSVRKSTELNSAAVEAGRAEIICGDAAALPYPDNSFDAVTAFETVYYWQDIVSCFRGVRRVLKDGGMFLVCNEDCSDRGIEEIVSELEMRMYTEDELSALMRDAGFSSVRSYSHENGEWICAVGFKENFG